MTDYIGSLQQALRDAAAREYPAGTLSPELPRRLLGEDAYSEQPQRRFPLDGFVSRRSGRQHVARWLTLALALAATLVAVALVLTAGGGPSIVARAYAATNTNGVIVHYIQTLQFQRSFGKSETPVHDVWVSGQQRHLIVPGSDQKTDEITINGSEVQNYLPGGTLATYRLTAATLARGCGPTGVLLGQCGRSDEPNPLATLRHLYQTGRLHAAGQTTIGGRRVDLITDSSQAVRLRAVIDPHTFIPIKIQLVQQIPDASTLPCPTADDNDHALPTTTSYTPQSSAATDARPPPRPPPAPVRQRDALRQTANAITRPLTS